LCDHNNRYTREVFSQATRELLAVACLTALYRTEELSGHIRYALRLNPPQQVMEAILQAGVYVGFPCTLNGLRIYSEIVAGEEE
jgi:alkylhydroperoxidase/carboxymuconolactone decarboxylase family protein YurZ